MVFWLIIIAFASYMTGNINWAIIISGFKKSDIRKMGSGNPGTLNMGRQFGLKFGLLTFFLDLLKGAVCSLVAYFAFKGYKIYQFPMEEFAIYLCGFCVVLGHIFPVVYKFKGGKGIATTIGVFFICESVHGLGWASVSIMSLVGAAVFIYFTEVGAMGSFIAIVPSALSGCIRLFYSGFASLNLSLHIITNAIIFLICFFTWFAHRRNIERMLAGEEHPTSIKQMIVKNKAKKLEEKMLNEESDEKYNQVFSIINRK